MAFINEKRAKKIFDQYEPCPCGSGKKYKKCCADIQASETAKLSTDQCKLFYETLYKLLDFVSQRYKVVDYNFSMYYSDPHDETLLFKIRQKLWSKPELIGEFLDSGAELSHDEITLLKSWEKHHVKGQFVLAKYESEYAVFMSLDQSKEIRLYGVRGITSSVAGAMQRRLPVIIETTLLPFFDTIIYDSFIASSNITFGKGIIHHLNNDYIQMVRENGIITKLN